MTDFAHSWHNAFDQFDTAQHIHLTVHVCVCVCVCDIVVFVFFRYVLNICSIAFGHVLGTAFLFSAQFDSFSHFESDSSSGSGSGSKTNIKVAARLLK